MDFIGRNTELEGLKGLFKKKSASLVVIRGRRRIGKSRLAEEFASSFPKSYVMTGLPPAHGVTDQNQRDEFARQMRRHRITATNPSDWGDLFTDLAEHCAHGRLLIVLDEITWMGNLDPTFLPKLKTLWDTQFKKNPKLILIISGSNSLWIEKNILASTGFVGRISYQLHLKELPLNRCNDFWSHLKTNIDADEKFKILSVTGGVPRYLEEIRTDFSAEQNIHALCYQPTGILYNEFNQIFSDLFAHRNEIYKNIILQVSTGKLTMEQIAHGMGRKKGGDFSEYLEDLVEAGFLARDNAWSMSEERELRLGFYRICDNYIRFYLKYIEPYKSRIQTNKMKTLPRGWKSIMGLQFENLVCNNAPSIYQALELDINEVIWSGPFIQSPGARNKGCQIDYLIQTKHRVLYLCEVKFLERNTPFSVIKEVAERSKRLKIPKGFSVRHVLIHVNGISEQIEYDEFFSNIIDFRTLLIDG